MTDMKRRDRARHAIPLVDLLCAWRLLSWGQTWRGQGTVRHKTMALPFTDWLFVKSASWGAQAFHQSRRDMETQRLLSQGFIITELIICDSFTICFLWDTISFKLFFFLFIFVIIVFLHSFSSSSLFHYYLLPFLMTTFSL